MVQKQSSKQLTDDMVRLARLRADLAGFGLNFLKIRTKDEKFEPFVMNRAQHHLHDAIEKQRAEKGWVRILVLKGRQQGISTYVAARYYHRASLRRGVNVYILSHEQSSTDKLFNMVDRYQRNNPIAPHVGASNAKELVFDQLDSSYAVATAGAKEGGRGGTVSLFHGSEVAFWTNAPAHFAASVQGVPLLPGTEVILESTSAGVGGEFYERWKDAEAGRGDYIPVFLPWFLSDEYSRPAPPDFELTDDADEGEMSEIEYAETFDLGNDQMFWRRNKILELRSEETFRREYPATPSEAWTAPSGHEPFIKSLNVLRARKREADRGVGPLILGVDPASLGGDRFSIAARRGMAVKWVKHRNKIDHVEAAQWIKSLIDEHDPARVNIDAGNIGAAVITAVRNLGPKYAALVRAVNFGATSQVKLAKPKVPGPANRRAEMWTRLRDWLELPEGASLPDMDALESDITAPKMKPRLNGDYLLESKKEMKARGVRSPDLGDAVALTFAENEHLTNYSEERKVSEYGNPDAPQQQVAPIMSCNLNANSWMG